MFGQQHGGPQTPGGGMYGFGHSGNSQFGGAGQGHGSGTPSFFGSSSGGHYNSHGQQQQQGTPGTPFGGFGTSSPFGNGMQMHASGSMHGAQSTSTSTTTTATGGRRKYLPGYLSGGAAMLHHQHNGTPDRSDSFHQDSPSGRSATAGGSSGMATSPTASTSRFGLFSQQDKTPSKSPKMTFQSVREQKGFHGAAPIDEDAPPVDSFFDNNEGGMMTDLSTSPVDTTLAATTTAASSTTSNGGTTATTLPSSSKGYAVTVFGFPSSALPAVLQYFSQFGEITSTTPSPEGGNWCTITYAQAWSAARAARRNGEVLGGVLMLGVKADDESVLSSLVPSQTQPSQQQQPVTTNGSTAVVSGKGTPSSRASNVVGASQAFVPTPTRRGLFGASTGTGAGTGGGGGDRTPFQERQRLALEAQQREMAQAQQKGVLGKVSDFVFGW